MTKPQAVGLDQIQRLLTLTDSLGIHREAVKIPLAKGLGAVRRQPNGKLEIVVDRELEFEEFLSRTELELRALFQPEE